MGLQAEPPYGVRQAKCHGGPGIGGAGRPVHGLNPKMIEFQCLEPRRIDSVLRKHQFQLISGLEHERGAGFRADADPVDAARRLQCAVGLDRDLEALGMDRRD